MSQLSTEYQVRAQMCEMLFEDYQKPIERYLMAWVNNQEIARDLCQDTFAYFCNFLLTKEKVVQSAAKYKVDLYTTAKYRAIDHLRQNKPIVYLSQSESEANSWFDEPRTEGVEDWICDRHRLREVLAQMPLRHQQCVQLIDCGFKQKKIATMLDISPATVSAILRDVKNQLQKRNIYPVTIDLKSAKTVWLGHIEPRGGRVYHVTDDLNTTEAIWAVYAAQESERSIRGVKGTTAWWKKFREGVNSGEVTVSDQPWRYMTVSEVRNTFQFPPTLGEKTMQMMGRLYILPEGHKDGTSDILIAHMVVKDNLS